MISAKTLKYEIRLGPDISKWGDPERWEVWEIWDNGNDFRVCIIDTNGATDESGELKYAMKIIQFLNGTLT